MAASRLLVYAGGVAVPDGPEAAVANAAAAALLTAAKVPGGFSDASFAGPTRDGRCGLHFTLRTGHQVSQLFKARGQLKEDQVASRIDPQRTYA